MIPAVMAVVMVLFIGVLLGMALEGQAVLSEISRLNTIHIPGNRIDSTTYMMGGLEKASTELDFQAEYQLEESEGDWFLVYETDQNVFSLGKRASYRIEPNEDFGVTESGEFTKLCISKNPDSNVKIAVGAC